MITYLDFLKSMFERNPTYLRSSQAPEDPWCREIKCGVYECQGYRNLTVEEWTHVDFPERFGPLTKKQWENKYLDGKELWEEEPVQHKGKLLMKVHMIGYDYDQECGSQ